MTALAEPKAYRCVVSGAFASVADPRAPDSKRFRKDILRVGTWELDGETWPVTTRILHRLVANFRMQVKRGLKIPVVWNHSEDARDKIGDVLSLDTDGQTLWATLSAPFEHDAKRLATVNDEVSVQVHQDWVDGHGNTYDWALTHIGVVNHPVVSGQSPFKRFQLSKGVKKMAKEKELAEGETEGGDSFTVDEVRKMLAKAGFNIPAEAKTKGEVMAAFLALTGGGEAAAPETPEMPAGDMYPPEMAQSLAMQLKRTQKELSLAHSKLAESETEKRRVAEEAYAQKLEGLISSGRIAPSGREQLIKVGAECHYKLSILGHYDSLPEGRVAPTTSKAKQLSIGAKEGGSTEETKAQSLSEAKAHTRKTMGLPAAATAN